MTVAGYLLTVEELEQLSALVLMGLNKMVPSVILNAKVDTQETAQFAGKTAQAALRTLVLTASSHQHMEEELAIPSGQRANATVTTHKAVNKTD